MNEDFSREWQASGTEHYRPINRMEFKYVFPDDMNVSRPQGERFRGGGVDESLENWVSGRGRHASVVGECVEPDVGHKSRIEGQGNTPVQTRHWATYAEIFQLVIL